MTTSCSWLELDITHGLHWIPAAPLPTSDLGFLSLLTLSRISSNEHAKWGTKGRGVLGAGEVWERVTAENIPRSLEIPLSIIDNCFFLLYVLKLTVIFMRSVKSAQFDSAQFS